MESPSKLTVQALPNQVEAWSNRIEVDAHFEVVGLRCRYDDYPVIFTLERDNRTVVIWGIPRQELFDLMQANVTEEPIWYHDSKVEELYNEDLSTM